MEKLVGFTRDSASVNGSALSLLGITISKAVKLVCFSHVANRWGQCIEVPHAEEIVSNMNLLMGHSAAVRFSPQICGTDISLGQSSVSATERRFLACPFSNALVLVFGKLPGYFGASYCNHATGEP